MDDFDRLRFGRGLAPYLFEDPSQAGNPAFVGQVTGTPPATTGCYYKVHPVDVFGAEAEGGAAALGLGSSTVLVYVMGGKPPVGPDAYGNGSDFLTCRRLRNRWVADPLFGAGSGITIAGCSCPSIPPSLTMTASNPAANNGMFQDCTLVYGPTPPGYAGLPMGPNSYMSPQSFTDQFNNSFRYFFYCQNNQFFLTRVYLVSIFGSPYEDTVRYTWTTGTAGNTCSPFLLGNGRVYAGGDTSDVVTISG